MRLVLGVAVLLAAVLMVTTALVSPASAGDCFSFQDGRFCACRTPSGGFIIHMSKEGLKKGGLISDKEIAKSTLEKQIKEGQAKKVEKCEGIGIAEVK